MIKRDVKAILPESYDLNDAPWFKSIREDYNVYVYRVILTSYLFAIAIPVSALALEIYYKRTTLILNYLIPTVSMLLMILYLVIFKHVSIMRRVAIITAIAGFFCAILLPGSYHAYIMIFFNFIPIVFALSGLAGGVRWFLIFISSIAALLVLNNTGLSNGITLYLDYSYVPMSFATIVIMFAITYAGHKQYEKIIKKLVLSVAYDSSTGLLNKDSFMRCMKEVDSSIIAILQITNFKNLSIIFGYEFSDNILTGITRSLLMLAKEGGFMVYKLSWHEFGLQIPVAPDFSVKKGEARLTCIIDNLREKKISSDGMDVNVAFCIGGVVIRDGNYANALSLADNALSSARANRRSAAMHSIDMNVKMETIEILKRYTDLYESINSSALRSYLQPVASTVSGKICWHESLLRVRDRNGEYKSIFGYIEIAKDTGLYPMLTEFMLDMAEVHIKRTGLPVSVNISQFDIMNSSIMKKIETITSGKDYTRGNLIIEITENEDIGNYDLCLEFIREVKERGALLAIDDFGAGYSNISNLLRLSPDIVKIDGDLIRRMEYDGEAFSFIKGIAEFCRRSGQSVVAEFIANEKLYDMAKEIEIEFCQGYYIGVPEDPENVMPEVIDSSMDMANI